LPDGYNNQDIDDCYEAAMKEGLYEQVQYHCAVNGFNQETKKFDYAIKTAKHYACTNAQEYFAELSVAFLSSLSSDEGEGAAKAEGDNPKQQEDDYNKWYPYNTTQLKDHDPRAFKLLQELWGVTK
jgi:hypothetical protein